jgi:hypothetical protein
MITGMHVPSHPGGSDPELARGFGPSTLSSASALTLSLSLSLTRASTDHLGLGKCSAECQKANSTSVDIEPLEAEHPWAIGAWSGWVASNRQRQRRRWRQRRRQRRAASRARLPTATNDHEPMQSSCPASAERGCPRTASPWSIRARLAGLAARRGGGAGRGHLAPADGGPLRLRCGPSCISSEGAAA